MFYPTSNIQCRDIKGVASGGVAILNFPKGPRYRRIILALQDSGVGNTAAPSVSSIQGGGDVTITLGSKVIRRFTGAQLDIMNTLNGGQYGSYGVVGAGNGGGITYLPIFFEEPWRKRADFQNGLACETGWLGTNDVFQISFPINAGTTTPVIGAMAIVDGFSSGAPNSIMKYIPGDSNTNAATFDAANIFQGAPANDLVETVSIFNTSDAKFVSKARLTINNTNVYDDVTFDQQTAFLKEADMNPTGTSQAGANAYHIVFDHDDLFESLRQISSITTSDLFLTLSAASAGTVRIMQQRLGLPTT